MQNWKDTSEMLVERTGWFYPVSPNGPDQMTEHLIVVCETSIVELLTGLVDRSPVCEGPP